MQRQFSTSYFFREVEHFLKNKLTQNIRDIISRKDVVVNAVAGSGKTTLVSIRIAYLLTVEAVPKDRILVMTFTNSGVDEIKRKFANLMNQLCFDNRDVEPPMITTYNAYAQHLIKTYQERENYLLSPVESKDLISDFLKSYSRELRFVDLTSGNIIEKLEDFTYSSEQVMLNGRLLQILTDKRFRKKYYVDALEIANKRAELLQIARDLELFKRENRIFTFNDQIRIGAKMIGGRSIREQEGWLAFVFDEYQDTSSLHSTLTASLTAFNIDGTSSFYVGDDMQSIFQWRDDSYSSMGDICKDNPRKNIVEQTLSYNYRSAGKIVDLVNFFLDSFVAIDSKNRKKLVAAVKREVVSTVKFVRYDTKLKCVAKDFFKDDFECDNHRYCNILRSIADGWASSCALLFRSNRQIRDFYLYSLNSNYFKINNYTSIFVSTMSEFLYIKALIRLIFTNENVFTKNSITCSILQNHTYQIKNVDIQEVVNLFRVQTKYVYLHEFIANNRNIYAGVSVDARDKFLEFGSLVKTLEAKIGDSIDCILHSIIFHTKLDRAMVQSKNESELMLIYRILELFKAENIALDAYSFLDYIDNLDKIDSIVTDNDNLKSISVSTIHKSKGREWNTVCLVDLVENILPLKYRRNSFLNNYSLYVDSKIVDIDRENFDYYANRLEKEELPKEFYRSELRLIYVALTRAKNTLIVCGGSDKRIDIFNTLEKKFGLL